VEHLTQFSDVSVAFNACWQKSRLTPTLATAGGDEWPVLSPPPPCTKEQSKANYARSAGYGFTLAVGKPAIVAICEQCLPAGRLLLFALMQHAMPPPAPLGVYDAISNYEKNELPSQWLFAIFSHRKAQSPSHTGSTLYACAYAHTHPHSLPAGLGIEHHSSKNSHPI
jgi:hypothetical protein